MRNEHGSSLNMVHYVAKEGVSLVDVGPSEKDARDDKVIIANLEDVVPRDLKDKIAKAAEGQPTRLRGMAFPRGSTKLMFYSEPVIGEGQGVFIKIDVAQSKPQFEWANINYQTTPRYDVPKSDDGRYAINVGKNLANTLGEGGEQELWIHDMVEDSSRQILQLNGKETLSSGFDVNGRECEANRFWPTWVKPHVMEFVVYEYAEPDNCDNHFKTLRTMQYDVDTSKMTSLTIGGVETLAPSPDGKYVAYRVLEKFVGCCGGPANIPFYSLWIMKSDGSGKVQVERPADVEAGRERVSFNGWYPDSSGIQYYYQEVTEATQASAIYRVGVDGKHPVIDKSAQYPWQKQGLF